MKFHCNVSFFLRILNGSSTHSSSQNRPTIRSDIISLDGCWEKVYQINEEKTISKPQILLSICLVFTNDLLLRIVKRQLIDVTATEINSLGFQKLHNQSKR